MNGSKVRVILLKGWILRIGRASAVEGLRSTGLPRLVSDRKHLYNCFKVERIQDYEKKTFF